MIARMLNNRLRKRTAQKNRVLHNIKMPKLADSDNGPSTGVCVFGITSNSHAAKILLGDILHGGHKIHRIDEIFAHIT